MQQSEETARRTFAKATTWQISGFAVMTALTWAITGSLAEGGAVAGAGAVAGFVSYYLHERAWARVRWGFRRP